MQRQTNFAVNYRSGIIPLYCSSSTTRRKKEEARRGKGRPPADSTRTQSFTYDQVNRIVSGAGSMYSQSPAHCWGETYTYDQWANMSAIGSISSSYNGCLQNSLSVSVTTNNQLSSAGFSYDAAGNMLTDNVNTYAWNAESEMKSGSGVTYTYDGDGNRLMKANQKIYWYGAGTETLDESDTSGNFTNEYVFFGGKRIAIRNVSSGPSTITKKTCSAAPARLSKLARPRRASTPTSSPSAMRRT
jgi:hypothetical protein